MKFTTKELNPFFKEWYYGSGCGEQNLCCKTEIQKLECAFLEGMKALWHDLRKAPNDLPKPNIAVLICMQFEKWTATYIAYYRPAGNKWQMCNISEAQRGLIIDDYIDRDEVIAWCEIPKFEEEQ